MDPDHPTKLSQSSDLKRKSQPMPLEPRDENQAAEQPAKKTKKDPGAESPDSSEDELFVPEAAKSDEDDEVEDLADSSSDEETQGFDLDGYLKYRESMGESESKDGEEHKE